MNHESIIKALDDATARVDEIVYIAGMVNDGMATAEPLGDLIEYGTDELIKALDDVLPRGVRNLLENGQIWSEIKEHFVSWVEFGGPKGFLVKVATPAMRPTSPKSWAYSWGLFTARWFYGETVEEAIGKGLVWVGECRERELVKAGFAHG